jgi:hypothetical protein
MAKPNQSPFTPLSNNGAEIADVFNKFRNGIGKGLKAGNKVKDDQKKESNRQEDYAFRERMAETEHGYRKAEIDHGVTAATNLSAVHGQQFSNFKHDKLAVGFLPNSTPPQNAATTRISESQVGAESGPKPKRVNEKKLNAEMTKQPSSKPGVDSGVANPFTTPA